MPVSLEPVGLTSQFSTRENTSQGSLVLLHLFFLLHSAPFNVQSQHGTLKRPADE